MDASQTLYYTRQARHKKAHTIVFIYWKFKNGPTSDLFEKGALSGKEAWEVLAVFHILVWAMATEGHQAVFNISVLHVFQTSIKKKKRTKSIKISKFISLQRYPRFWAVANVAGFDAVHRQSADLSLAKT